MPVLIAVDDPKLAPPPLRCVLGRTGAAADLTGREKDVVYMARADRYDAIVLDLTQG